MTQTSMRKPRILMIEDDAGDVLLFQRALTIAQVECELSVIPEGGSAFDMVQGSAHTPPSELPDLVLLDLNLPKRSGREILAAMRQTPSYSDIPVVVWTSSSSVRDRATLDSLQVREYLVKPFELAEYEKIAIAIKRILAGLAERSGESDAEGIGKLR